MSVLTIPKPPEREAWLRVRHGFFSASDAAALYGRHPFKTLADVAVEKLAPEPPNSAPTAAMDRGNRLEPVILDWYGDQLGVQVYTPSVLYQQGRLLATLDGEVVGLSDDWIEAKSFRTTYDVPPPYVLDQVTAQAAASGKKRCHIVWIDGSLTFKSYVYEPDPAAIADVLARAEDFMSYIDAGLCPPDVELTVDNVRALHPDHDAGNWADADDGTFQLIVEWAQARQTRLDAEKAEKALADRVAAFVGSCEGVTYDGREVVTFRGSKPTESFDAKRFRAENPKLAAHYMVARPGARRLLPAKNLGGE